MAPNMLGAFGDWAARSLADPPRLSFRQPMFNNLDAWRAVARARFLEALNSPGGAVTPIPVVQHQLEFEGLSIEHMHWQLPFGPPTEALLLKPAGVSGKLPGVTRRNVITCGADLNSLVGKEFEIQGVRFLGTAECSPCHWMDEAIAPGAERLLHARGGLRAKILTDGILRVDA